MTEIDGEVGLLVTVHEKNNAPPVLQIAFEVDGTQPGNVTFTLGGRLTFLDVGRFGSELRTDFQLETLMGFLPSSTRDLPRLPSGSIAPRGAASNSGQWIYSYGNPQADYRLVRRQIRR